ncbi:tetratricopeptide repeat protein [Streptomyces griseorubiginosus]|uniref:tetratricopeptide repeat protein n=1 Tax=Streptomyces griseorubiginosus TaxID=67304 RepID=UPI0036E247EF
MRLFRARGRDDVSTPRPPLVPVVALVQAGRYAEAEVAARALAESGSDLAPQALALAALAVGAQGRHDEAVAQYDALLPVFGRVFGAEHPQTLLLRSNRAQTLTALGRHAECETECAAVARAAARVRGPARQRMTAAARNGHVFALNAQGRHREAERLAREALAAHPTADRFALTLRLGLARALNGQARHAEALTEARRADKLNRRLPEEARRAETGAVELALASALLGLGRHAEARPRAVSAHAACTATFGPDHYRTAEARALLDRIDRA